MYVSLDYLRAEMGDCRGIRLVWSYYGSWSSMKLLQEGYFGSRRATGAFQGVGIRPLRQVQRQGQTPGGEDGRGVVRRGWSGRREYQTEQRVDD